MKKDKSEVEKWFFQFFSIQLAEQELQEGENPIEALSTTINCMELQAGFPQTEHSFLTDLLERSPGSFLAEEAYGKGNKHRFETLLEVATRDFEGDVALIDFKSNREDFWSLSKKQREEAEALDEKAIINTLQEKHGDSFRPAHRYVAVVHADGDQIGTIIKNLDNQGAFAEFSKTLKLFALDAVQEINDYGGVPVYAGGDDLLFFAPVVRDEFGNIFTLLERLNARMKAHFEPKNFAVVPTLSFGVAITFYKFPLFEALEASRNLLFDVAKRYDPRNAIAFSVRKHSGHEFSALLPGNGEIYEQFSAMLGSTVKNPGRLLSSINYHVRDNEKIYEIIGNNAAQVENFIDNCFNEAVHDEDETKAYLTEVKKMLPEAFALNGGDSKKAAKTIYALLRIADFLTDNPS